MKITKRVTPPNEEIWVGGCTNCGSQAECKRSELTKFTRGDRRGEDHSWEVCPVCGFGKKRNQYGGMLFRKKVERA
jgi:hypothetical protein